METALRKTRKAMKVTSLVAIRSAIVSLSLILLICPSPAFSAGSDWGYTGNKLEGGTNSTTLQGGTDSTTLQGGTDSVMLQTGTDSVMLQTGTAGALIHGSAEREGGPVTVLFVVDASLSMKEKLEGKVQKIDAAKSVLQKALSRIPSYVQVGVRVFGQFVSPGMECQATALLVPPGVGNRRTIIEKMRRVIPTGMTPITLALSQAAERDLKRVRGRKTIILITDGAETCGFDPCAYIRTLPARGIDCKVDIVGLDLKHDKHAKSQLDCIAKNSGGKYYDADTAAKLIESVAKSVSKAIQGTVLTPDESKKIVNPNTPPELIPIVPLGKLEQSESIILDDNPASDGTSENTSKEKDSVKKDSTKKDSTKKGSGVKNSDAPSASKSTKSNGPLNVKPVLSSPSAQ